MSEKQIRCFWWENGELQINPDGQVFPCCFIANPLYLTKVFGYPEKGSLDRRVDSDNVLFQLENAEAIAEEAPYGYNLYRTYIEHEDELNLNNKSMREIINHKWFKDLEKAREKWETAPRLCQTHCTIKDGSSGGWVREHIKDSAEE